MYPRNCKRAGSLALIALGVSALSIATAQAGVVGLYNTGVDVSGGQDQAWQVTGGTGTGVGATPYNAFVNSAGSGYPANEGGPWVANSSTSQWDTPTNPFTPNLDPSVDGSYVYETKFTVTGSVPSSIAAQFAADNYVASIILNGTPVYTGSPGNQYGSFNSFTLPGADLVVGQNTLDFTVINIAQNGGNPSGLNVEFAAPGPVPGAGLAGLGALALAGLYARTRRAVSAAAEAWRACPRTDSVEGQKIAPETKCLQRPARNAARGVSFEQPTFRSRRSRRTRRAGESWIGVDGKGRFSSARLDASKILRHAISIKAA